MMGPFQVTCVLAAAVLAAAFSTSTAFAREGRGNPPMPHQAKLSCLFGGLDHRNISDAITAIDGNPAESPGSRP